MPESRREIRARDTATVIKTKRELKKLIAGENKADTRQIGTVVSKLQVVIADYLDSGKPLKITLCAFEILSAVEAAIQEAAGQPSPWPDGADARTFFVHGLYDEIIQQPSNIPISRATWRACLEHLREHIIESGLKIARKRAGAK